MQSSDAILARIHGALTHETHLDPVRHRIEVNVAGRTVTLSGDVPGIASKRLAVDAVSALDGVAEVIDRLRLASASAVGDGAIRDAVSKWLSRDVDFINCTLRVLATGRLEVLREAREDSCGAMDIAVDDGVITLSGHVISLSHKRLAGVLAWWARGGRDVANLLEVRPAEEDSDEEVIDALRLALETDPLVHADQIVIVSRNFIVTLKGFVATEEERRHAELDAWYLHGVRRVLNEIEVRA
ncbi:BON domain-containing protein [Azoarcus sp. KH32C]|uniref:BON domain-containing protein n=1 Tax=Azoarcus sp. KH32C TaxID=748247 RepID=UPI00034BA56E|nr:BON domain-containing protein [Azoarcus sp. KH32C]